MTTQSNSVQSNSLPTTTIYDLMKALIPALDQQGALELEIAKALQLLTNKQAATMGKISEDGKSTENISHGLEIANAVISAVMMIALVAAGCESMAPVESEIPKALSVPANFAKIGGAQMIATSMGAVSSTLQAVSTTIKANSERDVQEEKTESDVYSRTNTILLKQIEEEAKGNQTLSKECSRIITENGKQEKLQIRG